MRTLKLAIAAFAALMLSALAANVAQAGGCVQVGVNQWGGPDLHCPPGVAPPDGILVDQYTRQPIPPGNGYQQQPYEPQYY